MRHLIYEANGIQTQKLWHSTDEEVSEPVSKKEFNPLMTTHHLVGSLKKILHWAIDFWNLEFWVALHFKTEQDSDRSEEDICDDFGRMHYHLMFYSTEFPKIMDKISKKALISHWKKQWDQTTTTKLKSFPRVVQDSGGNFWDKLKRYWHMGQQYSFIWAQ